MITPIINYYNKFILEYEHTKNIYHQNLININNGNYYNKLLLESDYTNNMRDWNMITSKKGTIRI